MQRFFVLLIGTLLVVPALAIDWGHEAPVAPDPDVLRQGGDTIQSATQIEICDDFDGTTAGYTDDYDETCPYSGSTSPDVVYTFTPADDVAINVDTYGSAYDTKIYIYDQDLDLVACNDDFYSDYTSRVENVPVMAGVQYFIVIDGYGGAAGVYTGYVDCVGCCGPLPLPCPAGAELEGEPPLVDGYVDGYNGGCNSPEFGNPFQPITQSVFCGTAGYYLNADGGASRDTDWFTIVIPAGGVLEVTGDAGEASYMFELGPQDCGAVAVVQNVSIGPLDPATMTITGVPGSVVWFWVGSQTFWNGYTYEYDYVLWTNLVPVATQNHSWSSVKALFD